MLQVERLRPLRRLTRNDDYGDGTVAAFQILQKVETAHLSHLDIRDYATGSGERTGFQKFFRGLVGLSIVSE